MLEVVGLCSGYGRLPVVRDATFSAQAGEVLLIVGDNGAGKTTLLRTIGGLIPATGGTVAIGGKDRTNTPGETMPRLGLRLVLDGHRVFGNLTVADNLRIVRLKELESRPYDETIKEIMDVFPILRERMSSYARDLSGGQQQMLALAQAFVAQPKVLLVDEPSTGLAQALLPPIMEFFARWAAKGTTIVMTEQHVKMALPIATRVLTLKRGSVAGDVSKAEYQSLLGVARHSAPSHEPSIAPNGVN